jgi:FAD/FMN-containing dehydrogenase
LLTDPSSGAGNASAKDVIISTRAFSDFEFDREAQVVTIGAGSIWQEYYEKMRDTAPEYSGQS